ncbi:MAG: hypothetical protein JXA57_09825 [Armatimonadetes bacterium]|nr:hypothetical protein [Armatimonadota bacterium]
MTRRRSPFHILRRLAPLVAVTLCMILAGGSAAQATEYVSPYPDVTYSDSGGSPGDVSDPVNCLFGASNPASDGTPYGVYHRIKDTLKYLNGGNDYVSRDSIYNVKQHVYFHSNYGNSMWKTEIDTHWSPYIYWYSVRYGSVTGTCIHTRLFNNPYATSSGSYAWSNCVTAMHHEHWSWDQWTHIVDEDFETTENNYTYTLSLAPGNTRWYDSIDNDAEGTYHGWIADGFMSKMTLYYQY